MKVGNFMSTGVIVLNPDMTLWETAALFLDRKIDGAPVMKNGQIIGLITKTHLIRALVNKANMDRPILEVMTSSVRVLHPDDDIRDVDVLHHGRYPVMKDGQLVGFITKSDIMLALEEINAELSGQINTVINSAYNPIAAIDNRGVIRIWNKAAEKYTGLLGKDIIGAYINEVVPESELMDIVKTGRSEFGIKLHIGNIPFVTNRAPVISNGEIVGAVAILTNISELEKVTRELAYVKSLNAELDAIIDSSFDGLYITDGEGMTIRVNKAIKRITGLGEEEVTNKTMRELVDNGVISRSATLMILEQKRQITTTTTTATGTTLLVSGTPVFDEQGNIFRVVNNVRDISELNMLKQKLERLEGLKKHFESQMSQMKVKLSGDLVFKSKEMENIVYQSIKIGGVDSTVLISGESGVGKEVIAEIIQRNSLRKSGPFVKLNCAAIPDNLIESELFGYENGAFTGAKKEGKPGLFEVANQGTLLLDEVGDIPPHLQVKLLRAIQEREILRVGGTKPIPIDVRIIAITNKDLESMVRSGEFREDLYYRLNVVPICVPALRDRLEDIPLLVRHFINNFNQRYNLKKSLDIDVIELLMRYSWPGNIRQLENLIERLVVTTSTEKILVSHLPAYIFTNDNGNLGDDDHPVSVNRIIPLKIAVENVEKMLLEKTFAVANSCYKAAEILGVDPSTVSRKARKYSLSIKN